MRRHILSALATLTLLGAAPGAGATTTVTTNVYSATSTSGDIALSCTEFKIGSSSGEVEALCNVETDGTISRTGTKIDLDTVIACELQSSGPVLIWGSWSATYPGSIESWTVGTDSTGDDYVVSGACALDGASSKPVSSLELSDTTNGLENDGGELDGR